MICEPYRLPERHVERFNQEPGEIGLYFSAWVMNSRATSYFGPVLFELVREDPGPGLREVEWEKAIDEVLAGLADRARVCGANAVVGIEFSAEPVSELGLRLHAIGTAAILEPIA